MQTLCTHSKRDEITASLFGVLKAKVKNTNTTIKINTKMIPLEIMVRASNFIIATYYNVEAASGLAVNRQPLFLQTEQVGTRADVGF